MASAGGYGATNNAGAVTDASTLAQGPLRGPAQSEPLSRATANNSGRLRLMPCHHTFAPARNNGAKSTSPQGESQRRAPNPG